MLAAALMRHRNAEMTTIVNLASDASTASVSKQVRIVVSMSTVRLEKFVSTASVDKAVEMIASAREIKCA